MWWLLAVALAAPPEGVDPEEADTWRDAWEALFFGPAGCWEVVGRATWDWRQGHSGWTRGDASFVGRLEDGTWSSLLVRSLGEESREGLETPRRTYPHGEQHFVPIVGRKQVIDAAHAPLAATPSVLSAVFAHLDEPVDHAWSAWDERTEAVVLHRSVPVGDGARVDATMDVYFPDGGPLPTYATLTFDAPFATGDDPVARVREASARLRGRALGDLVFPEAESFTFSGTVRGHRLEGAQTVRYTSFRPCGGAIEEETQSIQPIATP